MQQFDNGAFRRAVAAAFTALAWARRHLSAIVIALVAIMGATAVVTFMISRADQAGLRDYISVSREIRIAQIALLDSQSGVRGVVLSADPAAFATYVQGMSELENVSPSLFQLVDSYARGEGGAGSAAQPVAKGLARLRDAWSRAVMLGMAHEQPQAEAVLEQAQSTALAAQLQQAISDYLSYRGAKIDADWNRIAEGQGLILVINVLGAIITIGATSFAFGSNLREVRAREVAIRASVNARHETETLFGMTEILQSAATGDDANAVLRAKATKLLPDYGGALYVFNNSRDRLDFATEWGSPAASPLPAHIAPDACWALKRGKPHLNTTAPHALCCAHSDRATATFEIPIVARGEVHGLLMLRGNQIADAETLDRIQPVALALADAMSLALSNIVLRERLRNQALRDPLTGLYNRRFLEEMLDRLTTDAERRRAPVAAIMMDLDHFKNLNDHYGHAAGDLVLRDVASTVLTSLRPVDIACRYGGEEFAILLPDTTLEAAIGRAEQIRARVSALTTNDLSVTASFGVASMPENCSRPIELLPTADTALYQAKDQGRDRVIAAPLRPSAEMIQLGHAGWNLPEKHAGD